MLDIKRASMSVGLVGANKFDFVDALKTGRDIFHLTERIPCSYVILIVIQKMPRKRYLWHATVIINFETNVINTAWQQLSLAGGRAGCHVFIKKFVKYIITVVIRIWYLLDFFCTMIQTIKDVITRAMAPRSKLDAAHQMDWHRCHLAVQHTKTL